MKSALLIARAVRYLATLAVLVAIWMNERWFVALAISGLTVANEITALALRSHRADIDELNAIIVP